MAKNFVQARECNGFEHIYHSIGCERIGMFMIRHEWNDSEMLEFGHLV